MSDTHVNSENRSSASCSSDVSGKTVFMTDVNASSPCWILGHDSAPCPSIPFESPLWACSVGESARWVRGLPPPWLVTSVALKDRACSLRLGVNNNKLNPAYTPSRGITSSSTSPSSESSGSSREDERKEATRSPLEEPYVLYSSVIFVL